VSIVPDRAIRVKAIQNRHITRAGTGKWIDMASGLAPMAPERAALVDEEIRRVAERRARGGA
jgi:hypothetical protein